MKKVSDSSSAACNGAAAPKLFDEAMLLVGDFWILRIIDTLQSGEKRYCQIERAISGINPVTLTSRLKKLEHAQVIERFTETHDRQSVAYALTDKGRGLIPILEAIKTFTHEYLG